jgi:hypothetical protein
MRSAAIENEHLTNAFLIPVKPFTTAKRPFSPRSDMSLQAFIRWRTFCTFFVNFDLIYRGGQSRFTVVRMEKDMQVMIITKALLITIRQIIQINNTIINK